ncbi:MAG: ATP-binding cassette domain-containing protein [Pseudomonadota bacterium]|jgi:putative ABC transport system ATP-binding protein|nr:ATP-binding cassette domain-containing protein [Pseudomonadota bacterium]|tara:strand:- start:48 stop:665 length:618 start_codon:yes stop_codon:yes gene_type:complete
MSNIFSIENLYYQIDKMQIIKNINCVIKNGITIINGPNGAGKTTFLKLLFGLISPTEGSIIKNYDETKIRTSFVFQNPIFLNRTVKENLEHTLYCKNIKRNNWNRIISEHSKLYTIEHMLKLNINMLSGGELQLLSLIRSIIIEPHILFYDEPTNNLDTSNINLLIQIINKIHNNGGSIIMVSHNDFPERNMDYHKLSIKQGSLQ